MQIFKLSEGTAVRRHFYLHLVDATDGITPETGEATGQPQISKNGAAFANTSATLTAIGNGAYYVVLTATELNALGTVMVRYKSAATAEFQDIGMVGANDPYTALNNLSAAQVNAEVDSALNTAVPGSPTADSINERVKAIDALTEASGGGDLAAILADTNAVQGKLPSKNYLRGTADADGGMDTEDKADVEAEALDALNVYDIPTPSEIAGAVWDVLIDLHQIDGTFGKCLDMPVSKSGR